MAHLDIDYLDYLVVAADTADNSFGVSAPIEDVADHTFTIEVTVGNVQFCVGQPVGANSPVHAVGSKLILTNHGRRNIYYKAGAPSDAFIVGF